MKTLFPLLILILLLTNCSGSDKKDLVDVIIVNGKANSIYLGDKYFSNTDSVRLTITEPIRTIILSEKLNFEGTILPNSSCIKDEKGISKIYITLSSNQIFIEKKKNQRYLELEDATVYLPPSDSYVFTNEDSYLDNRKNFEYPGPEDFQKKFDSNRYSQVIRGLTGFDVSDYLGGNTGLYNLDNDSVFGASEDLTFKLITTQSRFIGLESGYATLQLEGEWQLLNTYDEVLYTHPLRTYTSIDEFDPEMMQGMYENGWFRSAGVTKLIEEALRASFYDFLNSKQTQYFLDKKNPLYKETAQANQKLPVIQLKNTRSGKTNLEENLESTVLISGEGGFGSGSIISEDGYILTNYHVINDMETITVRTNSGKKFKAKPVRCDKTLDIAVIKINCKSCKPISFSNEYHVGQQVYDIGTPLDKEHFNSVFSGIVSAVRKVHGKPYIQTNSVSSNGMSGGPLINTAGQQIGVRVWGLVDHNGDDIYGFCYYIPIEKAFKSLNVQL